MIAVEVLVEIVDSVAVGFFLSVGGFGVDEQQVFTGLILLMFGFNNLPLNDHADGQFLMNNKQ